MKQKAVFLDRDGVINIDKAYVHKIDDFEFIDGVFEACRWFINQGYVIIVVTNQSGIARGYYDETQFDTLTKWMCEQFRTHEIPILDVYYCPHHPSKGLKEYVQECECRKPRPGMLLRAVDKYNIDVTQSIMVGDKPSDMAAAYQAGVATRILVESGQSFEVEETQQATLICSALSTVPSKLK